MKDDTGGSLIDATQAVLQYVGDQSKLPWEAVQAKCEGAMAMVTRDEGDAAKNPKRRRITYIAREVLSVLTAAEWSSANELKKITHRFADGIYILRQNGYSISRRKAPRKPYEYKLVRGPGWPGWADGKPVGNKATKRRPKT